MSTESQDIIRILFAGTELLYQVPDPEDHIQRVLRSEHRVYEESLLLDCFSRKLPRGMIIDVGANIGNHTIVFAKAMGRNVLAIEPYPKAFSVLRSNVELNGVGSLVTLVRVAAGRERGRANIIAPPAHNWGRTGVVPADDGAVEVVPLDELKFKGRVALLKIDVEGMENDVLAGAKRLIRRHRPLIYLEIQNSTQYAMVNKKLGRCGYRMLRRFNHTPTYLFSYCRSNGDELAALMDKTDALARLDDLAAAQREMMRCLSQLQSMMESQPKASTASSVAELRDLIAAEASKATVAAIAEVLEELRGVKQLIDDQLASLMESQPKASTASSVAELRDVIAAEASKATVAAVAEVLAELRGARQSIDDQLASFPKAYESLRRESQEAKDALMRMASELPECITAAACAAIKQLEEDGYGGPPTDENGCITNLNGQAIYPIAGPIGRRRRQSAGDRGLPISLAIGNARLELRLPPQRTTPASPQNGAAAGRKGPSIDPRHGTQRPRTMEFNPAASVVGEPLGHPSNTISVIMTTFNSRAFVDVAARNILAQSHRDLELIIVDDASDDDTWDVLAQLAREDPRVRPVKMLKNRGTYWCKNYGLTIAKGQYVTFQDSDDRSDLNRLELQLQELQRTGANVCTCNYVRTDEHGQVVPNRGVSERKAIMAIMFDREVVLSRAGFFDSVRTSADDEFTRRLGIVLGHERICHVDKPLYMALVRDGSLTSDQKTRAEIDCENASESDLSFLSAPRREYVRQYTVWHERLKTGRGSACVPYPMLKRPFPAPSLLLPESGQRDSFVTASMASIPSREVLLKQTVESILPQVDVLNVYLNGYATTPAWLVRDNVHVVHSSEYGDLRDNGKFFFLDALLPGYHFTIDDDIIYPPDYVQKSILKIDHYDRQAIVGCHGVIFPSPLVHFMKDREVLHFRRALASDRLVNLLGTGTTAYHVDTLELSLGDFKTPGMADLWLAVTAKRQNIPMIAIERPERWLKPLDEADESSLYCAAMRDCQLQTDVAQGEAPWGLDQLSLGYPLIKNLLSRFSVEEIQSTALDLASQLQLAKST